MIVKLFVLDNGARDLPYLFEIGSGRTAVYDPFTYETYTVGSRVPFECIDLFMARKFPGVDRGRWAPNLNFFRERDGVVLYEVSIDEHVNPTPGIQTMEDCSLSMGQAEEDIEMPRRRSPRRRYLTLMTHSSFEETAKVLNVKELKLMRVVALRVLRVLTSDQDTDLPRARRRSVNLWQGHTQALVRYGMAIARELVNRDYKDTSMEEFRTHFVRGVVCKPPWVFWPRLRASHRGYINLRRLREVFAKETVRLLPEGRGLREHLRAVGHKTVRTLSRDNINGMNQHLPAVTYQFDDLLQEEFVFPNEN